MPRNLRGLTQESWLQGTCGRRCREAFRRTVPQKTNRLFEVFRRVRVKRWGKSPPLQAQARRHGKPHRVQGQIGDLGAARSSPPSSGGFRVLAAKTNDSLRPRGRRQNSAYSPSKINPVRSVLDPIELARNNWIDWQGEADVAVDVEAVGCDSAPSGERQ